MPRKGEEEGWPAKGAKRKKGRTKTGQQMSKNGLFEHFTWLLGPGPKWHFCGLSKTLLGFGLPRLCSRSGRIAFSIALHSSFVFVFLGVGGIAQ